MAILNKKKTSVVMLPIWYASIENNELRNAIEKGEPKRFDSTSFLIKFVWSKKPTLSKYANSFRNLVFAVWSAISLFPMEIDVKPEVCLKRGIDKVRKITIPTTKGAIKFLFNILSDFIVCRLYFKDARIRKKIGGIRI